MYNRYIPQADGSYRRNRMQEPKQTTRVEAPSPPPKKENVPPVKQQDKTPQNNSIHGFLKQLLPKEFDTGDLIIVLLLLLMAGDCEEDKSHALLTLALYFIM